MTEITSLTMVQLKQGLRRKDFSAVEAAKAFLAKADSSTLNAFTELCTDHAIAAAEEADRRIAKGEDAPLLGVPIAVKDVIVTKGIKTTCGSKILGNFVPPYNATVIEKLQAAGFVMLGKTNMDEFAMGSSNENSSFGAVRNPWDPERVPGGSSGGSAAAVAGRLAPAALGTDTGGSIRQPAAFCSLAGIKPTYGRVSRYGLVAYASSLDQIGPLARSVADCALLLQVIAGHDRRDSTSLDLPVPDYSAALGGSITGMRIGVPKEYFIGGLSSEVEASIRAAIAKLQELGAKIIDISLPHTEAAVAVYYIIAPAEASSNLARFDGVRYGHRAKEVETLAQLYARTRSEGFGREVKRRIMIGTFVLSSGYIEAYYRNAQKVRTLIKQDFSNAFSEQCDLILCPTAPTTAFKIGDKITDPLAMYLNDVFTIPVNLAGLPAINVPCGFDSAGLPIGLQLIGKPWDEETLFKVASAYEAGTEWHLQSPKGA